MNNHDVEPFSGLFELEAQEEPAAAAPEALSAIAADKASQDYALLRLIMVDSLSPGKIVELDLTGGTVITGRNGGGKTSILQALLLFLGENPGRIVEQGAGRDKFVRYYLPNSTSYLVFEYRRMGTVCQVAAYSDSTGDRIFFRFIRHGFTYEQFVLPDSTFVQSRNLTTNLRLLRYNFHEKQIESMNDYRSIIQHNFKNTQNKEHLNFLRKFAADYSFTDKGMPLSQIERITNGMFRRKTNFDDLQTLVVDCIYGEEKPLTAIPGDRRLLDKWSKDCRAYHDIMAQAGTMQALERSHDSLVVAEEAVGLTKAKLLSLHLDLQRRLDALGAQKALLQAAEREAAEVADGQRRDLLDEITSSTSDAKTIHRSLTDLEGEHKRYTDHNADEKASLAEKEPSIKASITVLKDRIKALQGNKDDLVAKYDAMVARAESDHQRFASDSQGKISEVLTRVNDDLKQIDSEGDQEEAEFQDGAEPRRQKLEDALSSSVANLGACGNAVTNVAENPALRQAAAGKQARTTECGKNVALHLAHQNSHLTRFSEAQRRLDSQKTLLKEAEAKLETSQDNLAEKRKFFEPAEDSLLHLLRTDRPDWGADIGKVIRPELLDRTDLSPSVVHGVTSFYGLGLDLSQLEAHPSSDLSSAQQEIEEAEALVARRRIAARKAQEQVRGAEQEAEVAAEKCQEIARQIEALRAALTSAEVEQASAEAMLNADRCKSLENAREALKEATTRRDECKRQFSDFNLEVVSATAAMRRVRNTAKDDVRNKGEKLKKSIASEVAKRLIDKDVSVADIKEEMGRALRANGIDAGAIKGIQTEIAKYDRLLESIDACRELVSRWQYFKQFEWPKRAGLTCALAASVAEKERLLVEKSELEAECKGRTDAYKSGLEATEKASRSMEAERVRVQNLADELRRYPVVVVDAYDPSWSFDVLAALAKKFRQDEMKHADEVVKMVKELQKWFTFYNDSTVSQFYEDRRSGDSARDYRDWIPDFKLWFDGEHMPTQRILFMDAKGIAESVGQFHKTMDTFHRKVIQFDRDLQAGLDKSIQFDSISNVTVKVSSILHDQKYWAAVLAVVDARRNWKDGGMFQLPPMEFVATIDRMLVEWEVRNGIKADLQSLVRINGSVEENGHKKRFENAADLEKVSSNGLSYLVLVSIFVAFINKIRKNSNVNIVWALDELKDLDLGNTERLIRLLDDNNITLVCAFPDPDPDTLSFFRNRYKMARNYQVAQFRSGFVNSEHVAEASDAL